MSNKLYRVTCKGMTYNIGGSPAHGDSYVIARDATEAYNTVKAYLDAKDLGFRSEREMAKIELIAEEADYPDCGTQLHIVNKEA